VSVRRVTYDALFLTVTRVKYRNVGPIVGRRVFEVDVRFSGIARRISRNLLGLSAVRPVFGRHRSCRRVTKRHVHLVRLVRAWLVAVVVNVGSLRGPNRSVNCRQSRRVRHILHVGWNVNRYKVAAQKLQGRMAGRRAFDARGTFRHAPPK